MSASSPAPTGHDLRSVMTFADVEAERLLDVAGSIPLDAMAWLSAHIAAVDRAVYPVVRRAVPDGKQLVEKQRTIASRLARTLRVVERRHSGDALAAGLDSSQLLTVLHEHIEAHKQAQSDLVGQLEAALTDAEQAIVITAYQRALEHAPTRPHPHLGRGGMVFRFDALRDRLLDVMDGRNVTVPRVARRQIAPGRWGSYWLGQPHDRDREAS